MVTGPESFDLLSCLVSGSRCMHCVLAGTKKQQKKASSLREGTHTHTHSDSRGSCTQSETIILCVCVFSLFFDGRGRNLGVHHFFMLLPLSPPAPLLLRSSPLAVCGPSDGSQCKPLEVCAGSLARSRLLPLAPPLPTVCGPNFVGCWRHRCSPLSSLPSVGPGSSSSSSVAASSVSLRGKEFLFLASQTQHREIPEPVRCCNLQLSRRRRVLSTDTHASLRARASPDGRLRRRRLDS